MARLRHSASILALAFLTSCAPIVAQHGRTALMGKKLTEMEKCLGVPDAYETMPDGSEIAQWNLNNQSQMAIPLTELALVPVTIPLNLAGTSVTLGSNGECHAVLHVTKGTIDSVEYQGLTDGVIGANGNCAPIVQGCLRMLKRQQQQQQKELPSGSPNEVRPREDQNRQVRGAGTDVSGGGQSPRGSSNH